MYSIWRKQTSENV